MDTPEVDLFASSKNWRLKRCVSSVKYHLAVVVDAFTINWSQWSLIYLLPPVKMITKVISYLDSCQGEALFVTPFWLNQGWFPVLQSRSITMLKLPNPSLS